MIPVGKQMANRLSDWIYPNLPEDLCFLKEGGGDALANLGHRNVFDQSKA